MSSPMQEFDYELPEPCIAQAPVEPRDSARLLVTIGGAVRHLHVHDLPTLVGPGDVIVLNETKVLPARLHLRKASGGAVEVLLLERLEDGSWAALVRPSKRVPVGARLQPGGAAGALTVEIGDRLDDGQRVVRLHTPDGLDELDALDRFGQTPLPPYIRAPLTDPSRYQTVFARVPGSVAAPTAGLHLTSAVLDACVAAGAAVHRVELVVGLDTFRPVSADRPEDHRMHSEAYRVPQETWDACAAARRGGGRVIAIGTTSVRAIESAAASGRLFGRTELFIHGRYRFAVVDVLLTNFHMPRSTLLLLLDAFMGPSWREAYELAKAEGYRFLSFGDAMLVARADA